MPLTSAYWPVPLASVVQSVAVTVMLLSSSLVCDADSAPLSTGTHRRCDPMSSRRGCLHHPTHASWRSLDGAFDGVPRRYHRPATTAREPCHRPVRPPPRSLRLQPP